MFVRGGRCFFHSPLANTTHTVLFRFYGVIVLLHSSDIAASRQ